MMIRNFLRSSVLLAAAAWALILVPASAHPGETFIGLDGNGNDISDVYEALYTGSVSGVSPNADNDSDGETNEAESIAGTNLNDPKDRLGFTDVVQSATTITGSWKTTVGKVYQMQASNSLSGTWTNEGAATDGTGGNANATCPTTGNRMFLRVQVTDKDTDGDGVTDWEEMQVGTNRLAFDSDGDGRSDKEMATAIAGSANFINVYATEQWVREGEPKQGVFTFVRRGGFQPLSVAFTRSGTATLADDYSITNASSVVNFATGQMTATISLNALADVTVENAETIMMTLNSGAGYTVGAQSAATVTIISQGLIGQYFNFSSGTYNFTPAAAGNFDPAQLGLTRRDPSINFNWGKTGALTPGVGTGTGAPTPQIIDDDLWGAQWTGFIIPKYTEAYQILSVADRGVKVYVSLNPITETNNTNPLRIDNWSGTTTPSTVYPANMLSSAEVSTRIMEAGRPYYFRVDYRDSSTNTNNANIDIRWSSASQAEETIPSSALTSEGFIGTKPVISSPLLTLSLVGAPFSYAITATNTPTSFAAEGLPLGLNVNPTTGIISGTIGATPGIYFVTIIASNGGGSDARNLALQVIGTGGNITREVWSAPLAGTGVSTVPVWTAPSTTENITSLQTTSNTAENFGDRIRGFITAPLSGNYQFLVSSDENVELWVSANNELAHTLKRSWIINGANAINPGTYNTQTSQASYLMKMKAGNSYYFEVIRRETTGNDHLSIAWIKPGDTVPEIIPGYALTPFSNTMGGTEGTLYIASLTPQSGAATLGSGTGLLRVNAAKTTAYLTYTYANLTGPIGNAHIHDALNAGAIIFDIDDVTPAANGEYTWELAQVGNITVPNIIASIESGQAYLNLHTEAYLNGEIKGFFLPVSGSQNFTPPPAPPAAELTLPGDATARRKEIARFLQQATFGARDDSDGVSPWDPDSIQAVESLGYEGWVNAQIALSPGPNPETVITQLVPPRIQYVTPTEQVPTLIPSGTSTGYNGSGPMADFVMDYYEKFPLSGVGNVGAPLESADDIWRAWWAVNVKAQDQLRWRVAFALSQILVVSEEGELDSLARAMVHYNDLLHYYALGNFRDLLEHATLNPAMGRYLDMLGNVKPNPAIGYIPNENYAREIMQLFSVGLRRLHPDGTMVLDGAGLPANTYEQPEVVGLAHVLTGWNFPGSGNDYVTPMRVNTASNHDFTEKLILENTVIPAVVGGGNQTVAQADKEMKMAHDVIFHHPNTGPFICRQLIQRMVTANPSPAYIYRTAKVFADNGSGVRGDLAAVVKAILLDSEARNQAPRALVGFGHIKEPVIRATQLLRGLNGYSYGETNYGSVNFRGMVSLSPNTNVDLAVPLATNAYTRVGNRALFTGDIVRLTNQSPSTDNGYYVFNGPGLALTPTASTASVATHSTDIADMATGIPTSSYPSIEGIPLTTNGSVLLRNQTNPAENGMYVQASVGAVLTRSTKMDEPAEFTGARVTVAAYRDPTTLAYSNKTFEQTSAVTTVGTSAVTFIESSATTAGKQAWAMGTTSGSSLQQTPLRAATVFNYYEPDFVFAGDTGSNGLYSPEFQITNETSVATTANWLNDLVRLNDTDSATPGTNGQGYDYKGSIKKDVKLDLTAAQAVASDGGALVDYLGTLLMPNQVTPRLRELISTYLNSLPETLVPTNSSWKYFTDATGLGGSNIVFGHLSYNNTNWKHPDFVDTSWTTGTSVFGYKVDAAGVTNNTGLSTVIPYGGDRQNKWISSYYRKEFTVTDKNSIASLAMRLKRDDGAIVYINGKEARRDNFTGVTVSGTTLATTSGDDGAAFFETPIATNLLVDGRNVITVEVHQNGLASSDIYFDLDLKATRNGTPAGNLIAPDRMNRVSEALYLLTLSPEFAHQN
jgi:hypothetical protein